MGPIILQTLLGSAGGIISAVVGWILTRQLRTLWDSSEQAGLRAGAAEAAAGNASQTAASANTQLERLLVVIRQQGASIDAMTERHDNLWAKYLQKESYDLRLKRIEKYLAEQEAQRATADAFRGFTAPQPVHTTEGTR